MRRTVQEEGTAWSDGPQTRPSGWEARSHNPHLLIILTFLFHQVANIEVKLAWQDNRLATTEISLNSSHRIGSRESV